MLASTAIVIAVGMAAPAHASSPTQQPPCVVTIAAEENILKLTRHAAKRWNEHTTALPTPYRLRVVKGDVGVGYPLKTGNADLGARYVNERQSHKVTGPNFEHKHWQGVGGGSMKGFAVKTNSRGRSWEKSLVVHELGHVLGATHEPRKDSVMTPILTYKSTKITKRAVSDLKHHAPQIIAEYCPAPIVEGPA